MHARVFSFLLAVAVSFVAPTLTWSADGENLVRHLPAGALGTVEINGIAPIIERLQNSDLVKAYAESSFYEDFLKTDQGKKVLASRTLAENFLGSNLWEFAKVYLGDQIALGVYPPAGGREPDGVLVVQIKNAADFSKLLDKLTPLITLAGDAISISDEEGAKVLSFKDGHRAIVKDRWLLLSKNRDLLAQTQKNLATNTLGGLEADAAWKIMAQQMGPKHNVQLCVNLAKVNELAGKRIVPDKLDNPVISLLYGGLIACAAKSPYLGVTLDVRNDGLSLQSAVAGRATDLDEAHRALVLDPSKPATPLIPGVTDRLGTISFSRNLATWYKSREQLLEAKLLPGFDKFETGIATFLPDKDFGEDVLSLLTGRIALVAAPQDYSYLDGKPGVQLPAFGLVVELAKPREGADILNLVSQTILTISNFEASKQKRHPWVQASETYRDVQINFARYLQRPKGEQLAVAYNFQPASALIGDRFIMSSSVGMCRQLVDALSGEKTPEASPVGANKTSFPNFIQEFSPAVAAKLLEVNAAVIEAKLIQVGKTADQASHELQMFCKLLKQLTPIRFDSVQDADHMKLEVHIGWK